MAFCDDFALSVDSDSRTPSPGPGCDIEDQRDSIVAAVEDLIGADASVAVGCGSGGVSGDVIESLLDVVANNSDLIDYNDVPAIADQVVDVLEQEGNGAGSSVGELVEAISEVVAENILNPPGDDVCDMDSTLAPEDIFNDLESVFSYESDGGSASITVEESTTVSTLERNEDGEVVPQTVIEEVNETTTTIEPIENEEIEEEEVKEELDVSDSDEDFEIKVKETPKQKQGRVIPMKIHKLRRRNQKFNRNHTALRGQPLNEDSEREREEEELYVREEAAREQFREWADSRIPDSDDDDAMPFDDNVAAIQPEKFMEHEIPNNEQLDSFVGGYLFNDDLKEQMDMSNYFHGLIFDFISENVDEAIRNAQKLFGCRVGYDFELEWIKMHVLELLINVVDEWRIQQDYARRVAQGYAVEGPYRWPNSEELRLAMEDLESEPVCEAPRPAKAQVTTTTKKTTVVKTGASKGAKPKEVQGRALAAASTAGQRAQPAQPTARPVSRGAIPKNPVQKFNNVQSKISTRHDPNSQQARPEKNFITRPLKPNLNQPSRLGAIINVNPSSSRQPVGRPVSTTRQPVASRVSTVKTTTVTRPASTTRTATVNNTQSTSARPTSTVNLGPTNTQVNRLAQARKEAADRSRGIAVTRGNSASRAAASAKALSKRTTTPASQSRAQPTRAAPVKTVARPVVSTRRPATQSTVQVTNRRTEVIAPAVVDDATARRIKARQDAADAARKRLNRGTSSNRPASASRPAAPTAGPSRPARPSGVVVVKRKEPRMVRAVDGDGGPDEDRNAGIERYEAPVVTRNRPPGCTNKGPRMVRAADGDGGPDEDRNAGIERYEAPVVKRYRPPGSTNKGPRMVRAVDMDDGPDRATQERSEAPVVKRYRPPGSTNNGPRMVRAVGGPDVDRSVAAPTVVRRSNSGIRRSAVSAAPIDDLGGLMASMASIARNARAFQSGFAEQAKFCRR